MTARSWSLALCGALLAAACSRSREERTSQADPEPAAPSPSVSDRRWLAVAAGAAPGDFQISIAQDLALAREALPGSGTILFGPGKNAQVATLAADRKGDELVGKLGDLLAPRGGRDSRFAPTTLAVDAPATPERFLAELRTLLSRPGEPAFVYVAGHGEEDTIAMWPQAALKVDDVGDELDRLVPRRRLVLMMTTCFGGSFADLAFAPGAETEGVSGDFCGLFATTGDLPADGCDPNPDRRSQEGYGIHFLNALLGRDRDGASSSAGLDVDGDGRISLLEAHTRARSTSQSANVPTTTSEQFLRAVAPKSGDAMPLEIAEERAVIDALAARLGLAVGPDVRTARERVARELAALETKHRLAASLADRAREKENDAYRMAMGDLLARWPVLDDPWHADYAATLAGERAAITAHLEQSPSYARYRAAVAAAIASEDEMWALRARAAPWENLLRAIDTEILAGRLKSAGGAPWRRYQRFLECERTIPR